MYYVYVFDCFDMMVGDIEELLNGDFVCVYEVMVCFDWKNCVGDFCKKMDGVSFCKYIIIVLNVNSDDDFVEFVDMICFLVFYGCDIVVVDIYDFVNVFVMELNVDELCWVVM